MGHIKFIDVRLYRYDLPLRKTFRIGRHRLTSRHGLIIQLILPDGYSRFGEIAPLPGLSRETLSQALQQTRRLIQTGLISDFIKIKKSKLFPSVRFGVESVLMPEIPGEFPAPKKRTQMISGLLEGQPEKIFKTAIALKSKGFISFKLKLGRKPLSQEIKTVLELGKILNKKHCLRLDANQRWTLQTTHKFLESVDTDLIDYIEEPVSNPNDLFELARTTNTPLALDESLAKLSLRHIRSLSSIKAIVIKPTILGGISAARWWASFAEKNKIIPVISSSFESSLGIGSLLTLAASLECTAPLGVDTVKYFKKDLLSTPIDFNRPIVQSGNIPEVEHTIRWDILKYLRP